MEHEPADDLIPPADPRTVVRQGLTGVALTAAAAAIGLAALVVGEELPTAVEYLRVALSLTGVFVAGTALTLGPGLSRVWAIAAIACFCGSLGLPDSWDSFQMLFRVGTGVAAAGAVLVAAPANIRYALISCGLLFHFGGILTATTWPEPTPWLTNQVGMRVYQPYLTFMYLRNAYHFYSPDPGPASHLFFLIKYELDETDPATGKPKVVSEWFTMPRRDTQLKDPLGMTYYRRLSLTELASQTAAPLIGVKNVETLEAEGRRVKASIANQVPHPEACGDPIPAQYRVPQTHISSYLLPSYVRYLASSNSGPGRKVVSVKIYRVEHRIVPTAAFVGGLSPHHPTTFKPYYYGEYAPDGKLIDPQDPMLYWLVPVLPKPGGAAPGDPQQKDFDDYLSKHAGFEFDWKGIMP